MQYLMLVCNADIFATPDPFLVIIFFSTTRNLNVLGFFLFKSFFFFLVQNTSHLLHITALLSAIIFFFHYLSQRWAMCGHATFAKV